MRILLLSVLFVSTYCYSFAQQNLYSKTYGDAKNKVIVFLHGGPGYNSVSFEVSTAAVLADMGFYVIVYDQRGCGRSKADSNSQYNFNEAFDDLNSIYDKYKVKSATLIGHSFGGTLAVLFAKKFVEKVDNVILVGSPLSYQMTFKNIISRCKKIYTEKSSPQLQYITMLEKMDTSSLDYSSYCFIHAMSNGFYKSKNPSAKSVTINASLKNDPNASYLSSMTREPVAGFHRTEHYTTLNLSTPLTELIIKKVKVYGIYGQEDGLFDQNQFDKLQDIIGASNFTIVPNASHNIFIDQQDAFVEAVKKYVLTE